MLPGQQGPGIPAEIQQIVSAYQMGRITVVSGSQRGQCYLCEHGLIGKAGYAPAQPLRWDQISVVWRQTKATYTWWTTYKQMLVTTTYIVQRSDGYTFSLDRSFQNYAFLRQGIEDGTMRVLFPSAWQSYMHGQMLSFGSLLVNYQGISNGRGWLLWPQVASVKVEVIDNEVVVVKQQGVGRAWAKVETSTVMNLHVLLALAEHVRRSYGLPRR